MSLSKALQDLAKAFGGTIQDNAARQLEKSLQELSRDTLEIGIFDPTNATKGAAHEFGVPSRGLPQRSFIRSTLTKSNKDFIRNLGKETKALLEKGQSDDKTVAEIGKVAVKEIQKTMDLGILPPMAEGGKADLQDTGALYNSISWRKK